MSKDEILLTRKETANFLHVTERTLYNLIHDLRPIRIGKGRVLYRRKDILEYVESRAAA